MSTQARLSKAHIQSAERDNADLRRRLQEAIAVNDRLRRENDAMRGALNLIYGTAARALSKAEQGND